MEAQALALGAMSINNVRYETSSMSKNACGGIVSIEVLAYGTAMVPVASLPKSRFSRKQARI